MGMATVGEDVLSGARTLDDEKRAAVEQHAERGVEIMRPLEVVGAVREMILAHHEWWNGSGYPRGLRGDHIPIGARILSVVDAFASMTAGRAYRPARTGRQALEEIRSLAGQQFDPAVVEAIAHALHVAELDDETEPGFGDDAPQVSTAGRGVRWRRARSWSSTTRSTSSTFWTSAWAWRATRASPRSTGEAPPRRRATRSPTSSSSTS